MKRLNNRALSVAAASAHGLTTVSILAKALHYACAARKDEQKHFPYTAAMEWRLAAELFGSNTLAGKYFWRQWQRIMHLPEPFARPVTDSRTIDSQVPPVLTMRKETSTNQIPLIAAA